MPSINIAELAMPGLSKRPKMVRCEIFMASQVMLFLHQTMKFLFMRQKWTADGSTGPKPVLNFWG
jgi:hypothetical protein